MSEFLIPVQTIQLLPAEEFDPNERAYPYADGELVPGVIFTPESVTFRGQRGPVLEVGENGCQVDALILVARETIACFNEKCPDACNLHAITKLDEALLWLLRRQAGRRSRGVEGTSQP